MPRTTPRLVPPPAPDRDPADLSDRELLEAIRHDDEPAFAELMERKTRQLLGLVTRVVGDREEARDLVQLTFLRVWENRSKFDRRWSPNTWLYRIATNLSIDLLRARNTRRSKLEPVRHHLYRVIGGARRGHHEELLQNETLAILRDLASDLSERQRLAFLLLQVEGLPSRQVAEILGCRESTVRNHLFAARKSLRRELCRRFPEYAAGRDAEPSEAAG